MMYNKKIFPIDEKYKYTYVLNKTNRNYNVYIIKKKFFNIIKSKEYIDSFRLKKTKKKKYNIDSYINRIIFIELLKKRRSFK